MSKTNSPAAPEPAPAPPAKRAAPPPAPPPPARRDTPPFEAPVARRDTPPIDTEAALDALGEAEPERDPTPARPAPRAAPARRSGSEKSTAQKLAEAEQAKEAKMRERDARLQAAIQGPTSHKFSEQDKTPQGQAAIEQGIRNKRKPGAYDYTRSDGADFDWPDLDPADIGNLEPWLCYTADGEGGWIDLNAVASGDERRARAAYRTLGYSKSEALARVDDESKALIARLEGLSDKDLAAQAKKYDLRKGKHYSYRDYVVGLRLDCGEAERRANKRAQAGLDAANEMMKEEMNEHIAAAKSGGLLDPIQGVSLDDWAGANAKITSGTALPAVLKVLGVEKPAWDAISAEWMDRMSKDTTFAISTVYGNAFVNPNIGRFAAAGGGGGAPKASDAVNKVKNDFEQYVKVMTHQNVAAGQGLDAATVLKGYGLSINDWSAIGAHWSAKLMTDFTLASRMTELMARYTEEFSKPGAGDDISF